MCHGKTVCVKTFGFNDGNSSYRRTKSFQSHRHFNAAFWTSPNTVTSKGNGTRIASIMSSCHRYFTWPDSLVRYQRLKRYKPTSFNLFLPKMETWKARLRSMITGPDGEKYIIERKEGEPWRCPYDCGPIFMTNSSVWRRLN